MDRDDMYHACLLVHGPPPPRLRTPDVYTGEFTNYRVRIVKWLRKNFEMRGDELAWFNDYYDWTQENRYHGDTTGT